MVELCGELLCKLKGYTLVTAESCTGGGIGAALTSVPRSSAVYKGGIICYSNWVKEHILGVEPDILMRYGAISQPVAVQMVTGVQKLLQADAAIAVTGLAGPDADAYENAVGTVFVGTAFLNDTTVREYLFLGNRENVRNQAVLAALRQLLEMIK